MTVEYFKKLTVPVMLTNQSSDLNINQTHSV